MRDVDAASPIVMLSTGALANVVIASPVAASYARRSKTGDVVSRPRTPFASAVTTTHASAGSAPGAKVRVTGPAVTVPPVAAETSTEPTGGVNAGAGSEGWSTAPRAFASSMTVTEAP